MRRSSPPKLRSLHPPLSLTMSRHTTSTMTVRPAVTMMLGGCGCEGQSSAPSVLLRAPPQCFMHVFSYMRACVHTCVCVCVCVFVVRLKAERTLLCAWRRLAKSPSASACRMVRANLPFCARARVCVCVPVCVPLSLSLCACADNAPVVASFVVPHSPGMSRF